MPKFLCEPLILWLFMLCRYRGWKNIPHPDALLQGNYNTNSSLHIRLNSLRKTNPGAEARNEWSIRTAGSFLASRFASSFFLESTKVTNSPRNTSTVSCRHPNMLKCGLWTCQRKEAHPSYSPSSSSNSPSSSAVASWYCWYSETKSFMFDSASVNSISSMPSPVYQCKNALRRNIAVKYSWVESTPRNNTEKTTYVKLSLKTTSWILYYNVTPILLNIVQKYVTIQKNNIPYKQMMISKI